MGDTRTPELFRWQWEHIHHPVSHGNLGKEEEELGAAASTKLHEQISSANRQKEGDGDSLISVLGSQLISGAYKNMPIGEEKLELMEVRFHVAKKTNTPVVGNLPLESYVINAAESHRTYAKSSNYGDIVFFQFHLYENKVPEKALPTDSLFVEFIVKKSDESKFSDYLYNLRSKPLLGDPLLEMSVQRTDINNLNNRVGGTYGCVRLTTDDKAKNCKRWSDNIQDFPHIKGKNKVHDGLDLSAKSRTPFYSMFRGKVSVGYSNSLGNYVLIESSPSEHLLNFEQNRIFVSYGHLDSYDASLDGTVVDAGVVIGYSGNSGSIAKNIDEWQYHLHLTIYVGNTNKFNRTNPVKYLTTKFDKNGNKTN